MRHFQFTLRRFSVTVAVVGISLGFLIRNSERVTGLLVATIIVAAAVWITYKFTQFSLRIRLTVEITTLLVLVALCVAARRPPHLVTQAHRATEAARLASECAHSAADDGARMYFRRKARWFSHRAFVFRSEAIWYGFLGGWPGEDSFGALRQPELLRELELARAIEILNEEGSSRSHPRPRRAPARP